MKRAYQYIRISTEDQSNFSLTGQDKINKEYALKHDIIILETFIDDGYSAKNFDRPDWRRLELLLAKNKNTIDYLIVSKYDRLIRNAAEGLAFIEKMEQKWNIKLLSVMENFFIDPHSPFFFKMRADLLVNAEFERRVISDRTRFGVWSAKTQGRFLGVAPFGYINSRDHENKPIILVNEEQATIIQQIFSDFLNDVPLPMIVRKAKANGFILRGHDALKRVLSNHVYAGLLVAPSYKDNISKVVQGTHQGIIPEDIFWRSYYKLKGKIRPQYKTIDENIPLRGFILCQKCGMPHTGAKSKGKKTHYYYYRCDGCKEYYNSSKVHNELMDILGGISINKSVLTAISEEAKQQLKEAMISRTAALKKVEIEINQYKSRINNLEEKFISDKIEQSTYSKWHSTYSRDLHGKEIELADLSKDEKEIASLFENNLKYLSDLSWLYTSADFEGKQALLRSIFPGRLVKEKIGFGTPVIHSMFYENSLKISTLLHVKKRGSSEFYSKLPLCTPGGNEIEHLLRVVSKIINQSKWKQQTNK